MHQNGENDLDLLKLEDGSYVLTFDPKIYYMEGTDGYYKLAKIVNPNWNNDPTGMNLSFLPLEEQNRLKSLSTTSSLYDNDVSLTLLRCRNLMQTLWENRVAIILMLGEYVNISEMEYSSSSSFEKSVMLLNRLSNSTKLITVKTLLNCISEVMKK